MKRLKQLVCKLSETDDNLTVLTQWEDSHEEE